MASSGPAPTTLCLSCAGGPRPGHSTPGPSLQGFFHWVLPVCTQPLDHGSLYFILLILPIPYHSFSICSTIFPFIELKFSHLYFPETSFLPFLKKGVMFPFFSSHWRLCLTAMNFHLHQRAPGPVMCHLLLACFISGPGRCPQCISGASWIAYSLLYCFPSRYLDICWNPPSGWEPVSTEPLVAEERELQ